MADSNLSRAATLAKRYEVMHRARKIAATDGLDFYIEQANNPQNDVKFRKQCWDFIFEQGFGKAPTQKTREDRTKKILVTHMPSRKELTWRGYAGDTEETDPQTDMAADEQELETDLPDLD